VLTERVYEELADDGGILAEERIAEVVDHAGDEVGGEIGDTSGWEDDERPAKVETDGQGEEREEGDRGGLDGVHGDRVADWDAAE